MGGGWFGQKRHGVVSWGEMTNNKGFFVRVFLGEVRGGRIGGVESGGGGCVCCGVLCWFWAEGAHWCLAGALRFWVAMCVRHGQVRSYLF